jgi:hypothetical protein
MTYRHLVLLFAMLGCVDVSTRVDGQGATQPVSGTPNLTQYPDQPLTAMPIAPVSPRFVVEHRSALNGKAVTVRGFIVRVITPDGDSARPGKAPASGGNPQPRLFVAESADAGRDRAFDLPVLLREGDTAYRVGDSVEVTGTVDGNVGAIVVNKHYRE